VTDDTMTGTGETTGEEDTAFGVGAASLADATPTGSAA
jgi:hypothetical protein